MSGLLIGILLARTVSGLVGEWFGWRTIYWLAAGLMLLVQVVLRRVLPPDEPHAAMGYGRIFRSLWDLLRSEPVVREAGAYGGLAFGAFSAFWVTLAFFLATPPYHYGSGVVGLFSLAGVAGALAASFSGRLADRIDARRITGVALATVLGSYVIFWLAGHNMWGLALGVVTLDLGTQATHISNQTRMYSLNTALHSRLNTIYMVSYFVGGSLGAALGAAAWTMAGWNGVCLVGALLPATALAIYLALRAVRRPLAEGRIS
jgi:predicted MFS family arabinose efflux permease